MKKTITRTQTGVRLETSTLKVLKGLSEYLDMSLGELIEGMVWHNFEGQTPFSDKTLSKIKQLRSVYDLKLTAKDSHKMTEIPNDRSL
jgi:hypothetical protein